MLANICISYDSSTTLTSWPVTPLFNFMTCNDFEYLNEDLSKNTTKLPQGYTVYTPPSRSKEKIIFAISRYYDCNMLQWYDICFKLGVAWFKKV